MLKITHNDLYSFNRPVFAPKTIMLQNMKYKLRSRHNGSLHSMLVGYDSLMKYL